MRLLPSILLVFVFAASAGLSLYGQCAAPASGQGLFLTQTPKAKAAMIAAASADIEERVDPSTGELYYVRRTVNPWSNAVSYQIVHYNAAAEQFEAGPVPESTVATNPSQDGSSQKPCPKTVSRDSCLQNRNGTLPTHQPRRSSTIKIAKWF